jgi:hypothetical protein
VGSLPNKEDKAMFAPVSEVLAWNIDILLEMVADDIEIANDIAQADYYSMVMALRSHAPVPASIESIAFDNHPFYGQRDLDAAYECHLESGWRDDR